jgi:rare lipoprotein A
MRVVGFPHRWGALFPGFIALALGLTACSSVGSRLSNSRYDSRTGVSASARVIPLGAPVPKGGGRYKLGAPYKVAGRWYIPKEDPNYDQTGIASWYGSDFHGRVTANGEIFDMAALTAAHPTLPLPSYAYVTNLENGRTVLVRINDRGPYANDRVIDLSREVARQLGSEGQGLARVRVRYAGRAPLSGDDRHERTYLASQPWSGGASGRRLAEHSGSYLRQW